MLIAQKTNIIIIPVNVYPSNIGLYKKGKLSERKKKHYLDMLLYLNLKKERGR